MASDFIPGLDWRSLLPGSNGSAGGDFDWLQFGSDVYDTFFGDDANGSNGNGSSNGSPAAGSNGSVGSNGMAAGCAVTLPLQYRQVTDPPPGYVTVYDRAGRPEQFMLKEVARSCGRWKPAAKPPIKARDWKTLRRAAAVQRRLDTVVKTANKATGSAPLRRVRAKSTRK